MYMQEKRLIVKAGEELKRRIPVLSCWKITPCKGSPGRAIDIVATAELDGRKYHFCIGIKSAGYPQHIRDGIAMLKEFTVENPLYCPVMVVPFMGERGKNICDEHGVGYLDFGGNAKISCGNIYIYTEGRDRPKDMAIISQSPFSPKATRVTKLLLDQPGTQWTQKDIVARTGLSKGMVSRLISGMIETGYVTESEKRIKLANFDDLLFAWVASEMKRRERKKHYYVWSQNSSRLMEFVAGRFVRDKIEYAFTQEAGASLVAPFATFDLVSVYVRSLDVFSEKTLSASEVDKGFNLTVIESPDDYVLTRARDKGGLKVVEDLQLYADLKKNPLRGEKQAGHILSFIRSNNEENRF